MTETLRGVVDGASVVTELHNLKTAKKIVLFCHGFPGTNRLEKLAACLPDALIAEINYRGDKQSGGLFSFSGCVADILSVAKALQERFNKEIILLGYSMGGMLAMQAARKMKFEKIVLLNPVLDANFWKESSLMPDLWKSAAKILRLHPKEFYEKEIAEMIKKNNPVDFKKKLKVPMVLVQGKKDDIVPVEDVEPFCNKTKCKLVWVSGKDHDMDGDEKELLEALQ